VPTAILVEETITRESGGVLSVPIQNASPKGASSGNDVRASIFPPHACKDRGIQNGDQMTKMKTGGIVSGTKCKTS
jgi:hypothetical protein